MLIPKCSSTPDEAVLALIKVHQSWDAILVRNGGAGPFANFNPPGFEFLWDFANRVDGEQAILEIATPLLPGRQD
jgi:hypothetical protein